MAASDRRKFYVSDLDGTLLRSDGTLSEFSRSQLARLLDEGLRFTVASARSVVAMQKLLAGLPLRLPVIEFNGALISDLDTGRHHIVHAIESALLRELFDLLAERRLVPFLSIVDGRQDLLCYSQVHNAGMQWYVADRKAAGDRRLRRVEDFRQNLDQDVVCVTIVDRRPVLEGLLGDIAARFAGAAATNFFENRYSPGWFWLTIHDGQATKDQAIQTLAASHDFEPEDLVVFGDHWNDILMFEMAGTAVAVANATRELKEHATCVIGSNDEDSVVRYILEDCLQGVA